MKVFAKINLKKNFLAFAKGRTHGPGDGSFAIYVYKLIALGYCWKKGRQIYMTYSWATFVFFSFLKSLYLDLLWEKGEEV